MSQTAPVTDADETQVIPQVQQPAPQEPEQTWKPEAARELGTAWTPESSQESEEDWAEEMIQKLEADWTQDTTRVPEPSQTPPIPQQPKAAPVRKAAPPQQNTKKSRKRLSPAVIAGIVAGVLVLALVVGVFAYGMVLKNGSTIYPNVYVAGINVGGMNRQEAIETVSNAVAVSYSASTLDVRLPDRTLSFQPEQTNVALDADEAVDEALAYGRSGSALSALTSYFSCRSREHYIDLQTILNLDTDYIRNMIDEVAAEVEQTPRPSTVDYNESLGRLTVQVGYPDRTLNADGLYDAVYNAFMNGDFTPLTWEYHEVPCEPVDLTPYYEEYCTEVQDAEYDETTHTISEEIPGYGFDLEAANQRLATASAGSEVVIQLEDIEPDVTKEELEHDMFGVELYTASSTYVNNSNRTNNLRLACEAINGTILNPGEVFSFNNVVGERTAAKGYLAATVYVTGGASAEELGGGVCQVASTIYLATLYMDLEQVQREPHMYAVTYVPYGMDATVYWGSIDYQFKNTLDYPIKIQADIENGSVNITFWGAEELGFSVEMSYNILETYPWSEVEELDETKPVGYRELSQTAYTGYKVVTYKTIYDANGNQISKELEATSVYKKRDKVYIVGPTEEVPEEPIVPEDPLAPDNPDVPADPLDPLDPLDPNFWQ